LAIAGEQGSAKTVLSKLLRAVIDPSVAPVRALPRDERELFIAASNGHVLAFDNLSGLPPWLSDTLCRLASGSAFSTRRLFTDQDEILFAAARPVILNGIEDIITRPDLADRAILLTLGAIAERQRRPEHALWREFELARPHILGALLDAAAHGLRMLPPVFGRLAGYEDVNDAERLRHDPAMRWIVGGKAAQRSAASPSQMGRFETQGLPARTSLLLPTCLASGSTLCTAEGHPVASCSSGLKREPDPRRAGDERLERPLRLHLLSPAVRVQPVWRPRTLCSACRQRAQH